jgi:DivIVA domain-containing protein
MKKKKDDAEDTFSEVGGGKPLPTPMDVQQKEFHVSRMGGYRMRDVDEFLDEITNSMSALVEENRRLKERLGNGAMIGAPDLEEVSRQADEIIRRAREEAAQIVRDAPAAASAPVAGAPGPEDRAAISAFLLREREFLQSLAGLVQGHAEGVKTMAKDARAKADAAAPPPAPPSAPEPEPEPEPSLPPAATIAEPEPEPEPATFLEPEPEPEPEPATRIPPAEPLASDDRPTEAMEEPVRIEEPEPATVGRTDAEENGTEEGDRSLRELFWGEE